MRSALAITYGSPASAQERAATPQATAQASESLDLMSTVAMPVLKRLAPVVADLMLGLIFGMLLGHRRRIVIMTAPAPPEPSGPRKPCCEIGRVTEGAMYDQRRQAGRAVRARVPRSAHEAWQPPDDRPDPIELLEENNLPRPPTSCRRDYDALVVAVESGRITAARGLLAAPPRERGLLRASRIACW